MPRREINPNSLVVRRGQPLIGVPDVEDGEEVVRYFVEDTDAPARSDATLRDALSVIGAWSDLDWEDFSSELDRIRHESQPTPPIEL